MTWLSFIHICISKLLKQISNLNTNHRFSINVNHGLKGLSTQNVCFDDHHLLSACLKNGCGKFAFCSHTTSSGSGHLEFMPVSTVSNVDRSIRWKNDECVHKNLPNHLCSLNRPISVLEAWKRETFDSYCTCQADRGSGDFGWSITSMVDIENQFIYKILKGNRVKGCSFTQMQTYMRL